jgi:Domain of unknown function (DUF5615)
VVQRLRAYGYDILTVQEAGQANQRIPDGQVLQFVLSQNRRDFVKLHNQSSANAGIVVCSKNLDWDAYTTQIHRALNRQDNIAGQLLRITK